MRRGEQANLTRLLATTLLLGIIFVVLQGVNWVQLYVAGLGIRSGLYAFTFYLLTALHAVHVVGGIIPLTVVTMRAARGRYGPEFHPGVKHVSMYWHFLDAVWIVLFATLLIA